MRVFLYGSDTRIARAELELIFVRNGLMSLSSSLDFADVNSFIIPLLVQFDNKYIKDRRAKSFHLFCPLHLF